MFYFIAYLSSYSSRVFSSFRRCSTFLSQVVSRTARFNVVTSILTVINMTGVANLLISIALALGACFLLSRSIGLRLSRTTLPHQLSGFRIFRRTRLPFEKSRPLSFGSVWISRSLL